MGEGGVNGSQGLEPWDPWLGSNAKVLAAIEFMNRDADK